MAQLLNPLVSSVPANPQAEENMKRLKEMQLQALEAVKQGPPPGITPSVNAFLSVLDTAKRVGSGDYADPELSWQIVQKWLPPAGATVSPAVMEGLRDYYLTVIDNPKSGIDRESFINLLNSYQLPKVYGPSMERTVSEADWYDILRQRQTWQWYNPRTRQYETLPQVQQRLLGGGAETALFGRQGIIFDMPFSPSGATGQPSGGVSPALGATGQPSTSDVTTTTQSAGATGTGTIGPTPTTGTSSTVQTPSSTQIGEVLASVLDLLGLADVAATVRQRLSGQALPPQSTLTTGTETSPPGSVQTTTTETSTSGTTTQTVTPPDTTQLAKTAAEAKQKVFTTGNPVLDDELRRTVAKKGNNPAMEQSVLFIAKKYNMPTDKVWQLVTQMYQSLPEEEKKNLTPTPLVNILPPTGKLTVEQFEKMVKNSPVGDLWGMLANPSTITLKYNSLSKDNPYAIDVLQSGLAYFQLVNDLNNPYRTPRNLSTLYNMFDQSYATAYAWEQARAAAEAKNVELQREWELELLKLQNARELEHIRGQEARLTKQTPGAPSTVYHIGSGGGTNGGKSGGGNVSLSQAQNKVYGGLVARMLNFRTYEDFEASIDRYRDQLIAAIGPQNFSKLEELGRKYADEDRFGKQPYSGIDPFYQALLRAWESKLINFKPRHIPAKPSKK